MSSKSYRKSPQNKITKFTEDVGENESNNESNRTNNKKQSIKDDINSIQFDIIIKRFTIV